MDILSKKFSQIFAEKGADFRGKKINSALMLFEKSAKICGNLREIPFFYKINSILIYQVTPPGSAALFRKVL